MTANNQPCLFCGIISIATQSFAQSDDKDIWKTSGLHFAPVMKMLPWVRTVNCSQILLYLIKYIIIFPII